MSFSVMPDLIRHPEGLEKTGFRLEFIPMEIGAGMTILIEGAIYKQTPITFNKKITANGSLLIGHFAMVFGRRFYGRHCGGGSRGLG